MSGRGGRRASVPDGGWRPVDRVEGPGGTLVRFVEERTGRQKVFDFSGLPGTAGMRQWLARAFARRTGPRSGIKHAGSAANCFVMLRAFAASVAEAEPAVGGPDELTAAHMAAFRLAHGGRPGGAERVVRLRSALRDDPELPGPARTALLARPPRRPPTTRPATYDEREWRLIMAALRSDVRRARDRIRGGRQLLADHRAGALPAGGSQAELGCLLELFDSTGELPRRGDGSVAVRVTRAGGVSAVTSMLCLTLRETTAFCLLLCALTGENFGTVAAWPAVCYRPGGQAGDAAPVVALVEQAKPRRGPEREHMVVALEDLPHGLADLLEGADGEARWLSSPVRVYRLLVEVSETSRRLGGHLSALSAYTPKRNAGSSCWVEGVTAGHVWTWARGHGFPSAADATEGGRPPIEVRRIRQTVIERDRRPVSHTAAMMNDRYLAGSPTVQAESRVVVGDALREQVDAARARQPATVLTSTLVADAEGDLATAADRAGLPAGLLAAVIDGYHDTVLAACIHGQQAAAGAREGEGPCTLSFLACLDCPSARALPRHLSVQIAMADRLAALAAHVDPPLWRARYQPRLEQLAQILGCHTAAEQASARAAVTPAHLALVDDVLAGQWDLR